MFRAPLCSSSGESIVSIQHLVYVTLCRFRINIYEKRIVRQIGHLQELYRDARSAEHKKPTQYTRNCKHQKDFILFYCKQENVLNILIIEKNCDFKEYNLRTCISLGETS
jgi:hypothetical protein